MALLIRARSHPYELVGQLCDLLAAPPDDLFIRELVAVPTRGIERWLTQRISSELGDRATGDGVCANVEFPSPWQLVREVLLAVPELAASVSAWDGTTLTRSLAAVLDSQLDKPWMWLLARYIHAPGAETSLGNSQRLRAAHKITGLFTRYARRRPDMVRAWLAGVDVGPDGEPLSTIEQWQPELWRRVRKRVDVPSLPELLPGALGPIRDGTVDMGFPDRLFVYGLTAADPLVLDVLEALAARREVYLYLLHPSPSLWHDTAHQLGDASAKNALPQRVDDSTRSLARHPLLRSWAQESRELQLVLANRGLTAGVPDEHKIAPTTLLARLQHDIRTNTDPIENPELRAAVAIRKDRSIQIHVCHGARRQVEVLRDAIYHVLAADGTLEPRDIVIMTPDLATFAPLLEAAFPHKIDAADTDSVGGATEDSDVLPDLRVRIADRAPAATNPLVRFAATVLDLTGSRLEASTARELVALPVVRQRFGFDGDTADAIVALIDDANVRWGLDADHRAAWDAGTNDDHTWRRGLDRTLAGVFYADSTVRTINTIAPLDGLEGQDARSAGLLAQIVDRIVAVRDLLGRPRPHSDWGLALATAVRLLASPAWGDEWQWSQLERLLEESFPPVAEFAADPEISAAEAALVVETWSRDVPSPLHFRTGDITVCTLVPMRSVPYGVVCLLGMDDERFPRSSRADGDDLLVDHEIVGDADRGAEDRQLLLDALMAAGNHLIVTYSGRDELTNAVYSPAVPIAELEDTLHAMVAAAGLSQIVTYHPLQPFSEVNFVAGRLGVAGPWAFDPMQLDGAIAKQQRNDHDKTSPVRYGPGEIPTEIRLENLIRFLEHPAKQFIRTRLGFTLSEPGEIPDDTLPADLDALGLWSVTDRLLTGLLEGHTIEQLEARERGTDALPPGDLGRDDLEVAKQRAVNLRNAARQAGYDPERHVQFAGAVSVGGRVVEGSIAADPLNARIDLVTPSRLKGKQRLRAFVRLVFLTALDPGQPWHALMIGRHDRGDTLRSVTIGQLGDDSNDRKQTANRMLADLVDLYVEGLTKPIPLPCETAYAWQRNMGKGRGAALREAGSIWEKHHFSPEGQDPANHLLFSHLADTGALVESGFPEYAGRLWAPIIPLLREKRV